MQQGRESRPQTSTFALPTRSTFIGVASVWGGNNATLLDEEARNNRHFSPSSYSITTSTGGVRSRGDFLFSSRMFSLGTSGRYCFRSRITESECDRRTHRREGGGWGWGQRQRDPRNIMAELSQPVSPSPTPMELSSPLPCLTVHPFCPGNGNTRVAISSLCTCVTWQRIIIREGTGEEPHALSRLDIRSRYCVCC